MRLSLVLGLLVSAFTLFLWGVYSSLVELAPRTLGVLAAAFIVVGFFLQRKDQKKAQGFLLLFETFHFGIDPTSPRFWLGCALVSLGAIFAGGVFGFTGLAIEASLLVFSLAVVILRRFGFATSLWEPQTIQAAVACIVSAAFSAAFGMPVAGALLAVELFRSLGARVQVAAMLASLSAYGGLVVFEALASGLIAQAPLRPWFGSRGFEPFSVLGARFSMPDMSFNDWALFLSGGLILAAVIAFANRSVSYLCARVYAALMLLFRTHEALKIFGLAVLIAIVFVGEPDALRNIWAFENEMSLGKIAAAKVFSVGIAKLVVLVFATAVASTCGVLSGLVTIGTLLGYAVGDVFQAPWATAYALIGGVCFLAVSMNLPITAIVAAFMAGLSGGTWWVGLISILASVALTRLMKGVTIHELVLRWGGLRIVEGRVASVLRTISAKEAMVSDVVLIGEDASISELRSASANSRYNVIAVMARDARFLGLLELDRLPRSMRAALLGPKEPAVQHRAVEIRDLLEIEPETLLPEDTLDIALDLLSERDAVAVVGEAGQFQGILLESGVSERYRRELALRTALVR